MPSNTPINRNRFITVFDTDAERAAIPPNSIPFGQFVYSIDTRQLRIADGTAVWPAPVGGGGGDGTLNLARLASLTPLPLMGAVALVDGVAPVAGDVLAAFGQVGDAGNGLYVYNPLGAWLRAPDFDDSDEVKTGSLVVIQEGATLKSLVFELTTSPIPPGPIAPLLPLAFEEVAGPFYATAQPVGAANSGGTSDLMSRGDHTHLGVHSVTPGTGITNSGTAADPTLNVDAGLVTDIQSVGGANAAGASGRFADASHVHVGLSASGAPGTGFVARFTSGSTVGNSQITDNGSIVGVTAATTLNITAGGPLGPPAMNIIATVGTIFMQSAGAGSTVTIRGGNGVSGALNLQGSSTLNIQCITGSVSITGAVGANLISTAGDIFVSVAAAAGTATLNAGAPPIVAAPGRAAVRGLNGVTINGMLFLGVTTIAGLAAGIFVGLSPAFAYATNLHKLTAAGPYPTLEGGAGTGGLVERAATGVWYIPGTLIPAS
jgi:hypothetical protein